jgi:alpha,alpha-trehalose-phosphate synthase [UDP-forming]
MSADAVQRDFVVVANRLPVDVTLTTDDAGAQELSWQRSPGGLVTALEPVMRANAGAWVGWSGTAGLELDPFEADGVSLIPVPLSAEEVADFYEGFSNGTLWPLYHDVIVPPEFHREWWTAYERVNRRFADAALASAAPDATVWVHDYQLQLVPAMIREARPDVRIGFFNHIPFPPVELFSQLPWRRRVVEGLLGSDLVGFQRSGDAANFLRAVRRFTDFPTKGQLVAVDEAGTGGAGRTRQVRAAAFPISIDSASFDSLARSSGVTKRAKEIRRELGNPDVVLLGVDRLDYTKGIGHRIKAYSELLAEGRLTVPGAVLVQVASPSRGRVEQYKTLRNDIELAVGRINGDYGTLGYPAVQYLHQSYPQEEMAALFKAADVMLVTALRDGMNLVAKEYVAARHDGGGALVLSEFTGAADELTQAIRVNPHDIDSLKASIMQAIGMDRRSARRRMLGLRRRVLEHDVTAWAEAFLRALGGRRGESE